jgi:hypothetical protein
MKKEYFLRVIQFLEYCCKFYSNKDPEAPYPIASPDEIYRAIYQHLEDTPAELVEFDSLDREKVRQILEPEHKPL